MENLFKVCDIKTALRQQCKLNLQITKSSQVSFGSKSPEDYFETYQTSMMERFLSVASNR